MTSRKKSNDEEALLSMLSHGGKQAQSSTKEAINPKKETVKNLPKKTKSKAKPSSFSLTEEDENCIASFAMWLMSQGMKTTNRTLVARTVLRMAEKNQDFLDMYHELSMQEQRRKK